MGNYIKYNYIKALVSQGKKLNRFRRFGGRLYSVVETLPRKVPVLGWALGAVGFTATCQSDGVAWACTQEVIDKVPPLSIAQTGGDVIAATYLLVTEEEVNDEWYIDQAVGDQLMKQMELEALKNGSFNDRPWETQCTRTTPMPPRGPDRPPFLPGLAPPLDVPSLPPYLNPQEQADRRLIEGSLRR